MRGATIAAVASPPGGGRRGIIRLSGPGCTAILAACVRLERALDARGLYAGTLADGRGEQPVSVLWMPGPHSYTREDVAELHLLGSPFLLDAALRRLLACGAESAEPGEFTRRAFENGRIDLSQAEGVLELVESSNAAASRAGLALLTGGLGQRVAALREELAGLRALCEASLDFDEDATGHVPTQELLEGGQRAARGLREALAWERRREPHNDLPRVVLCGPPNAGKSALFNRLSVDGRALVSDLAGTTRDVLRGLWSPAGVLCVLVDTAGFDGGLAAGGDLERRAQERAQGELLAADLVLWVEAADAHCAVQAPAGALRLVGKCDLLCAEPHPGGALPVSAWTGAGLPELAERVAERLGGGPPQATAEAGGRALGLRHLRALELAHDELEGALEQLAGGLPIDLVAEGLRRATDALDAIAGRTTPEDLLDLIFARFCMGK